MPARRALPLAVAGDALEGSGPALHGAEVTAHVALSVGGKAVEMDFVLPIGAGGAGAAGVPVHGCVVLAGSPGAARAPHCTLDFAHPVTVVAATPGGALALVAAVDLGVSAWRLPAGQLALAFAPPPPFVVPGPEGLQPHPESANDMAVSPAGGHAVARDRGAARPGERAPLREWAPPRGRERRRAARLRPRERRAGGRGPAGHGHHAARRSARRSPRGERP